MKEQRIIPIDLLPGKCASKWNGTFIDRTRECPGCLYHSTVKKRDGTEHDACLWGVTWKRLNHSQPNRSTCAKLHQQRPIDNVDWHIELMGKLRGIEERSEEDRAQQP